MTTPLQCPKCQGEMRQYERNGVHVDQCADCRGIFLDRGELERLTAAESAWHGDGPTAAPEPVRPPQPQYQQPQYQQYQQPHYSKHRKRKSFLEELFD